MSGDAGRIAKVLGKVQEQLRHELLAELQSSEEELNHLFDPHSYSLTLEELREKFINRLYVLQHIIQELNSLDSSPRRRQTRILTLVADDHKRLTKLVNKHLTKLDGCRVIDVKFTPTSDQGWFAVITYVASAAPEGQEETARWS